MRLAINPHNVNNGLPQPSEDNLCPAFAQHSQTQSKRIEGGCKIWFAVDHLSFYGNHNLGLCNSVGQHTHFLPRQWPTSQRPPTKDKTALCAGNCQRDIRQTRCQILSNGSFPKLHFSSICKYISKWISASRSSGQDQDSS